MMLRSILFWTGCFQGLMDDLPFRGLSLKQAQDSFGGDICLWCLPSHFPGLAHQKPMLCPSNNSCSCCHE